MKTILITGGAGFIGSLFTRHLFRKYPHYRLIVVDNLTYAGHLENLPVRVWRQSHPQFEFWYGSVTSGELMDTLVSRSDAVVHFAAESHVTRSIYDNTSFFMTDVIGTQMVCNAISKYRERIERFVHISSSEVYGTALTAKMNEEHPLNPMSPYASAKAGADRLVYSYRVTYGIPAVILRPFNNYGPRQHLEKLVPRFITSAILGEEMRCHGDGSAARDFIYVVDNCEAIDAVLHAPAEKVVGEVFNIGSGQHRTVVSIAQDVCRLMEADVEKTIVLTDDRPGQVVRHTADISKIERTLGWKPAIGWEEGLKKTIQWYVINESWWRKQLWMREIPIILPSGKRALH